MSDKKYVRAQITVPSTPNSAKSKITEVWRENTEGRVELFLESLDNILSENPTTSILKIRTTENSVEIITRDNLKGAQIKIQYTDHKWI